MTNIISIFFISGKDIFVAESNIISCVLVDKVKINTY